MNAIPLLLLGIFISQQSASYGDLNCRAQAAGVSGRIIPENWLRQRRFARFIFQSPSRTPALFPGLNSGKPQTAPQP
jgi:hypothetical protein